MPDPDTRTGRKPLIRAAIRRDPGAVRYLADTGAGTITCQDVVFPDDAAIIDPRNRKLLMQGTYEEREFRAALMMVKEGEVVLELGAGMGFMSSALSLHRKAVVHAFEANPVMAEFITRVHRMNGITTAQVRNAVLGTGGGTAHFYVRRQFEASSLISPADGGGDEVIREVEVPVMDIGQVLRDTGATVLVCDIEGAEADLLPRADLSSLRAAIVELHPQWIHSAGVRAVFQVMDRAGLVFYPKASDKKVVAFRKDW